MNGIPTQSNAFKFANNILTNGGYDAADLVGAAGGGVSWQSVQTTGFTAVAGRGYPCNTTSSAFTVTLPASPSVGDQVLLLDYAGTFATNKITIARNGSNIEGAAENKLLTTNREAIIITYVDSTQGWLASSGVNEGTVALSPNSYSIDFLVIAGGGGGGSNGPNAGQGGGGGAGGYRTSTQTVNIGTAITVTVGNGGAGASAPYVQANPGVQGSSSSISGSSLTTITSAGGGGGGNSDFAGGNGGSGGGAGGNASGGTGNTPSTSPSQGNNGASGGSSAGGGGGAGEAGDTDGKPQGGDGVASSITGSSVTRAGGGAGGSQDYAGGDGGGGRSYGPSQGNTGQAGTANTGGGGGAGYIDGPGAGGAGGSGIVILSVPTVSYSGTSTGSPTITTSGSNTILQFTGSGSYTA
jgi:hypothetical protein